jgi:release factor glutamine methyltransferase
VRPVSPDTQARPLQPLADRLAPVAGEAARIEARWLLEAAAGDAAVLESLLARRLAREPVDRVLGRRGFWTLDLAVTSAVLSPRSDTETIVRAALDAVKRKGPLAILDLGTGSGAILLALLAELPEATGVGVDLSPDALDVARANAKANGLGDRAMFEHGDWGTLLGRHFDLVVSNPPYIPSGDIPGLDPEVRDHDPPLALDGGMDGLDAYRAILPLLPRLLADGGSAVLEIGIGQSDDVARLAGDAGLKVLEIRADLGGIPRAMVLELNPPSAAAAL